MPDTLGSAKRAVRSAFAWWLRELQATVPDRLQSAWHRRRRRMFLTYRNGEIRKLGTGGDDAVLRCTLASGRRRPQATLRLRPDQAVSTALELPLAARDHLRQLLYFEMDRLTPFHPNDVYFAYRMTATDHERQRIAVAVHVAPASLVDEARKAAYRLGIEINRVELCRTDGGSDQAVNLFAADPAKRRPRSRSNLVLALIAVVVLAGSSLLILTHWQSSTAKALEQRVAAAKVDAEASLALRQRLQMLIARQNIVVKRKIETPMIVRLIAELTQLIPHQAYVTQLNMRDNVIHVHGYAEAASELIGALAKSDLLHEPQFRSPLTREPHSSLERFHISMQVGQRGE